jgi:hypothetical protein
MVSPEMVSPEATHRSGTDKGTPSSVGRQAVNKLLGQLHGPGHLLEQAKLTPHWAASPRRERCLTGGDEGLRVKSGRQALQHLRQFVGEILDLPPQSTTRLKGSVAPWR